MKLRPEMKPTTKPCSASGPSGPFGPRARSHVELLRVRTPYNKSKISNKTWARGGAGVEHALGSNKSCLSERLSFKTRFLTNLFHS